MSERLHEQLSALLDGGLPAGEAELLLARLQRDPALRATLARYTLAGDAIRIASLQTAAQVEPVASASFAGRISAAIETQEQQQASVLAGMNVLPVGAAVAAPGLSTSGLSTSGMAATPRRTRRGSLRRWLQPLGGVALAAGVAGLALMVVPHGPVGSQVGRPTVQIAAAPVAAPALVVATEPKALLAVMPSGASTGLMTGLDRTGEPVSYTTPLSASGPTPTFIPAAELASYVVAHSEVSGPWARRNVLTGLAAEPVAEAEPSKP